MIPLQKDPAWANRADIASWESPIHALKEKEKKKTKKKEKNGIEPFKATISTKEPLVQTLAGGIS
jgi:hypothetical protein